MYTNNYKMSLLPHTSKCLKIVKKVVLFSINQITSNVIRGKINVFIAKSFSKAFWTPVWIVHLQSSTFRSLKLTIHCNSINQAEYLIQMASYLLRTGLTELDFEPLTRCPTPHRVFNYIRPSFRPRIWLQYPSWHSLWRMMRNGVFIIVHLIWLRR